MKTFLQKIIYLLFVATFSCDITTASESDNVIASDNFVQFELYNSGPFDLVMTSLKDESIVLKISDLDCRPTAFFRNDSRYFFTCIDSNKEKTIWEIEEYLGRVMQLDLQEKDLMDFEKLKNKH